MTKIKQSVFCSLCNNDIPFVIGRRRQKFCHKCKKIGYKLSQVSKLNGKKCKTCQNPLSGRQRCFCSVVCQGLDTKKRQTKPKKTKKCIFCQKDFLYLETSHNKNLYCTRSCKDEHQKDLYCGKNNPSWNRVVAGSERILRSNLMKEKWESDPGFRKRVNRGQRNYQNKTGYWPGTDPTSQKKKETTNIQNFGVKHVWQNPESRNRCEETCLNKYGKHSWELAFEALPTKDTKIEQTIFKILSNNSIEFKQQYRIYSVGRRYKQFDFYIPKANLLIEADGDYWHANPKFFAILNEVQCKNKQNDEYKNKLAAEKHFKLIRYWENVILQPNFEQTILKDISTMI